MLKMDLHSHSVYSDGINTPIELLDMAKKKSLDFFSITDHDTIKGNQIVLEHIERYPFSFLTGIELTVHYKNKKMELLAYNFDLTSQSIINLMNTLQKGRKERICKILENLDKVDLSINYEDINLVLGKTKSPGRPHVARALMKKGYVNSIQEAFDKYLGRGRPGYVQRKALNIKETIEIIKKANGTPIMPHPLIYETEETDKLKEMLDDMIQAGVEGIEIYYDYKNMKPNIPPKIIEERKNFLLDYCKKKDLLITGGSDFHGDRGQIGSVYIPEDIVHGIKKKFFS